MSAAPVLRTDCLRPANLDDHEAMTLSACMIDPTRFPIIRGLLSNQDWSKNYHAAIFRAIGATVDAGEPIDPVLVWRRLDHQRIDLEQFAEIIDSCPCPCNAEYYARLVAEAAAQRRIADMGRLLAPSCRPVGEIIAAAESTLADVRRRMAGAQARPILDLVREEIEGQQTAALRTAPPGVRSGIPDLDRDSGPLANGYLVVLGARPSMGKSCLALQIAAHAAETVGPVLVFPIETGGDQLARNLLAQLGRLDIANLTARADMTEYQLTELLRAAERVVNLRLWVDDTAYLTVTQAWGRAAALQARHGLALVVVDYLQLMRTDAVRGRSREQEVAEISRGLKAMARSLGVPVLACAQINRAAEHGEDKRPRLAHLRESGQIEADADLVLLLHRQEWYEPAEPKWRGWAEIQIAKRKVGRAGQIVRLGFEGESLRFYNRAKPHQENSSTSRERSDTDG